MFFGYNFSLRMVIATENCYIRRNLVNLQTLSYLLSELKFSKLVTSLSPWFANLLVPKPKNCYFWNFKAIKNYKSITNKLFYNRSRQYAAAIIFNLLSTNCKTKQMSQKFHLSLKSWNKSKYLQQKTVLF